VGLEPDPKNSRGQIEFFTTAEKTRTRRKKTRERTSRVFSLEVQPHDALLAAI